MANFNNLIFFNFHTLMKFHEVKYNIYAAKEIKICFAKFHDKLFVLYSVKVVTQPPAARRAMRRVAKNGGDV